MVNQKIKTEIPTAAVNLKAVFLNSSSFAKGDMDDTGELKMDISITFKEEDRNLFVTEKLRLSSALSTAFNFEVEMTAEFKKGENFDGSVADFSNINGGAIIYAYLRQHVSNTTLQAGMKPIILPIVNFFEHFQRNKKA